jgi:hypothetical protein
MFRKDQESDGWGKSSPPRIGEQQPVRSKNVSVIGPTMVFKGELSADEDLVIEGTIEGTIAHHKKNLTIGKRRRAEWRHPWRRPGISCERRNCKWQHLL